nr:putative capsid protein [Chicken picobirnavirus]
MYNNRNKYQKNNNRGKSKASRSKEVENDVSLDSGKGKYNSVKGSKGHRSNKTLDNKSLPGNNDVSWYTLDPTILKDAASYPFSSPVGSKYQAYGNQSGAPGIMVLDFEPNFGYSDGASSAINLAAMKFYAFVRQANSGSKNYESSDLMMYFMAVTNLYSALAHFKRCYGLVGTYSNYNMYLGKPLVNALGMDYTVLRANQADLRRYYNTLVDQINMALHIPTGLKISERHVFCNSAVFVDSPGKKFQIYAMKQKHYLAFDPTTYATGTALVGSYPAANGEQMGSVATVDPYDYLNWLDSLVAAIVSDEDINIMSGDVLKAYGDGGCYKLSYLEADYVTPITMDVMMLSQIHNYQVNFDTQAGFVWKTDINKTSGSKEVSTTVPTIVQENNIIRCAAFISTKYPSGTDVTYVEHNLILDIPVESPTPADVMESTRLMAYADSDIALTDGEHSYVGVLAGSEIVTQIRVVVTRFSSNSYVFAWSGDVGSNWTEFASTVSFQTYLSGWIVAVSAFDWHPFFIVASADETAIYQIIGDMSNFSVMTKDNIKSLHNAAIYGEFDVPVKSV